LLAVSPPTSFSVFFSLHPVEERERAVGWVSGSQPWLIHYIGKLRIGGNTPYVVHPGCFFFNRRRFLAV